jgi:choline dehydrogenase-like flavoprotein
MVAEFADEVNRPGDLDPVHQIKEFEPDIGMGCSISTPPVLAMALAGHEQFRDHRQVTEAAGRMGLYYAQSNFGIAKVRPLPWTLDPFVSIRFTPAEKRRMLEAVVLLGQALFEAGARTLYPSLKGCLPIRSREELARLPDKYDLPVGALTSVHAFSACPMSEDERIGAVDSFGKVHGCERLFVVGASTLCTPTGVNPQGTVMAIAHRNTTELIRRKFR